VVFFTVSLGYLVGLSYENQTLQFMNENGVVNIYLIVISYLFGPNFDETDPIFEGDTEGLAHRQGGSDEILKKRVESGGSEEAGGSSIGVELKTFKEGEQEAGGDHERMKTSETNNFKTETVKTE